MAQVINTNTLSLVAQNNLNKSQSALGTSIERLSSGLRINSAKDDAAGMAISNRFTSSINGLSQASRNANDGISIAQTTEGALDEINDNLQNIRRLTVQAQNGTNSDKDRGSIQEEIDERLDEVNRICDQTEFNGVKVLSSDQKLTIQVGANDGETIEIDLSEMNSKTLNLDDFNVGGTSGQYEGDMTSINGAVTVNKGYTYEVSNVQNTSASPTAAADIDHVVMGKDGKLYAHNSDDQSYYKLADDGKGNLTFDSDNDVASSISDADVTIVDGDDATASVNVDMSGISDPNAELESDADGNYYIKHEDGSWNEATIDSKGMVTEGSAAEVKPGTAPAVTENPLEKLDAALSKVDDLRSRLGAVQNRFDSVINNLNSTVNNLSASQSRILDADYATEVSNMSRAQILQQAGTSVLAQANQVPQNVLSLLR